MFKNLILFFLVLGSLTAQNFKGNLTPFAESPNIYSANDTLNILAVMVEFVQDQDDATFGDGKFGSIYSKDYGNDIIDPLPHNVEYFEDHFLFAENYFRKVSNGKQNIKTTVPDQIITVSKKMRDYSPSPQNPNDLSSIVDFVEEVWEKADQELSVDFSKFQLFSILHAGVGRDVDLPGSIGNERDLPSLYLGMNSFRNYKGSAFNGFEVDNGNTLIQNSMILPETESRELQGIGTTTLVELSINGLIVASIASHLGLPDLFDTETGLSAIGRFGLMDGQSIFAFGGLFPPEPSPWEKIYLGWETPVTVQLKDSKLNVTAKLAAAPGDTTLLKIPINSSEYYLVENRSRDANNDGCKITYKANGRVLTRTYHKDSPSFVSHNIDTLAGVIIDVDEFDWAVPAFEVDDEYGDPFEDVGIVIWHIDETVIESEEESNSINNDPDRRGVALVEADGINDIGVKFQTIFGDEVVGEGGREDTWYKNNPAEYYKNRFNDNTKPSAKSNSGAYSLLNLSGFSNPGNRMSFNLKVGGSGTEILASQKIISSDPVEWISADAHSNGMIYLSNKNELVLLDQLLNQSVFSGGSDYYPAFFQSSGSRYLMMIRDSSVVLFSGGGEQEVNIGRKITAPPIVVNNGSELLIGTEDGLVVKYSILLLPQFALTSSAPIVNFTGAVKQIASDGNFTAAIGAGYEYWDSNITGNAFSLSDSVLQTAVYKNSNAEYFSVVLLNGGEFNVINNDEVISRFIISEEISHFSLADVGNDGNIYIITSAGGKQYVCNLEGAVKSEFPYENLGADFASVQLSADLNSNDKADIFSFSSNGVITAVTENGELHPAFPLSNGTAPSAPPIIINDNGLNLITINSDNYLSAWKLSSGNERIFWSGAFADQFNSSFVESVSEAEFENNFFPNQRAYNWPNPVYDSETFFRFYVSENSDVEINIFDLSGDLAATLDGNAVGGMDNEIAWDVSNIQSGGYFAHLKVQSISGRSAYKIIKVAVIK